MSRFDIYTTQIVAGAPLHWKHELLGASGEVLVSTEPREAPIEWGARIRPLGHQITRVSSKTSTLSAPVTDDRIMPDRSGTLLHPDTANRVRSWAGITGEDGEVVWWCQSTMLPNRVVGRSEKSVPSISAPLVDALRPVRSQTLELFGWDDGEPVEDVVSRMLDQVLEEFTVAPTGFVTPSGAIKPGSDRIRFVSEMLEGCGHEITTTPLGEVVTRKILSTVDDGGQRWKYGGDEGLPIGDAERIWNPRVPQAWRVEGGSYQNRDHPIDVTVYDTDPTSEGFYDGRAAAQVQTSRYQWVKTQAQGAEAGYGQLRRNGVGPMRVRFQSVPNPALRENDLVELEIPELNVEGIFRAIGFSNPQQLDGQMSVEVRKVWDPQVDYRPPIDVEGCVPAHSDDFNRPDQNLENTRDGGSVDWMEFGYSFNIRNQQCVQLNKAWCLAVRTNPICSADHYSQITIARIPPGKYLGPAIGSAGGFECYAAVIDHNGTMRLEKWVNGRKVHQFGETNIGAPAGTQPYIQKVGSTITAGVGGNTIVAQDSGLTGTYIGLIGTGGWGSEGSAAEEFEGGES